MPLLALQVRPSLPQLELDKQAAIIAGFDIKPFTCEPFTHNLIDFDPEADLVRGDTRAIDQMLRLHPNKIFYDEESFNQTVTHANMKQLMLNYGSKFQTWNYLLETAKWPLGGTHLFIRPNGDLKRFVGQVFDTRCFDPEGLFSRFQSQGDRVSLNDVVCLAIPQAIKAEYRVIVINYRPFFISRTHYNGHLSPSEHIPSDVAMFAEQICRIWLPNDTVVFDVADTGCDLKIVEFNCWNASGFITLDLETRARIFMQAHAFNKRRK